MNKKKYLSLLTAGSLIAASVPAGVLADTAAESGVVYYTADAVESSAAVDAEIDCGELFGKYSGNVSLVTEAGSFTLTADEGSAVVSVDENGSMTVEFGIENGGEVEPVYVLAFNGYYSENNKENELVQADVTTGKADRSDDVVTDGAVVVTSVKMPLEGEKTDTYAANVTLYVPELSDETEIENENGVFDTDCLLTVDWNSIQEIIDEVTDEVTVTASSGSTSSGSGGSGSGGGLTVNGYTSSSSAGESEADDESGEELNFHNVQVKIGSKTVVIDGEEYDMDIAPYIQSSSSSTMVPLRFVALAISGGSVEDADSSKNVSWDADTKTAAIKANGSVIKFTAGSDTMIVDGEEIVMEYGVEAEIKGSRMFVPFRALGNALGVDVEWDADTKTAIYN